MCIWYERTSFPRRLHYPMPMMIIVRQFNFHLHESCCTNFSTKKTLIGHNTLARITASICRLHMFRVPLTLFCEHSVFFFFFRTFSPALARTVHKWSRHLVIRVANFMLLLASFHVYVSWSAHSSLCVFFFCLGKCELVSHFSRLFYAIFTSHKMDSFLLCSIVVGCDAIVISIFISIRIFMSCVSFAPSRWRQNVCNRTSYEAICHSPWCYLVMRQLRTSEKNK